MASAQDSQLFHWHYTDFRNDGRTLFSVVVLFSIILLVTLLILYARWVCCLNPHPTTTRLPHAPPDLPRGLDPTTIRNLPIVLHRSTGTTTSIGNLNEVECCICLGVFSDGEKVMVLPGCRHCYHSECVDKWLRTQSSCPLCRASLRVHSSV